MKNLKLMDFTVDLHKRFSAFFIMSSFLLFTDVSPHKKTTLNVLYRATKKIIYFFFSFSSLL